MLPMRRHWKSEIYPKPHRGRHTLLLNLIGPFTGGGRALGGGQREMLWN